jgi:pilus assembly protein CpaB
MRSRSLVVALALLLAVGATAAVFLYLSNVKRDAETGGALTSVIVSKTDIVAGSEFDALIDQGAFEEQQVPSDAIVDGVVTDLDQLQGRTAAVPILAGEQIALSRVSGTEEALPGGLLGLKEGFQALTVKLDGEQFIGPALAPGDHVTFYAWFDEGFAAQTARLFAASAAHGKGVGSGPEGVAVLAVPDARVLDVTTQEVTAGDEGAEVDQVQLVTLELTTDDALRLVYSQNEGRVWFGLIRPGDTVAPAPPVDVFGVPAK